MAEDKEKKDSTFSKIMKMTETVSGIIEKISSLLKNQLDSFKKKLIRLGVAFGLIFLAVLIILIGLGQFLTNRFTLEPGLGAIMLGGSLLILTLLYLAIKR